MGRERRWRIETRGEGPFRGLQAFEARHEDVFFGRDPEIHAAKERLDRARDEGWGALLLLGQSGVGCSLSAPMAQI
jgi:eukaryotic-like serine/threonine-protein kinase